MNLIHICPGCAQLPLDGWTDKQMDRWTDDRRMDGWMDAHRENMQTPGPSCCEATALSTDPPLWKLNENLSHLTSNIAKDTSVWTQTYCSKTHARIVIKHSVIIKYEIKLMTFLLFCFFDPPFSCLLMTLSHVLWHRPGVASPTATRFALTPIHSPVLSLDPDAQVLADLSGELSLVHLDHPLLVRQVQPHQFLPLGHVEKT